MTSSSGSLARTGSATCPGGRRSSRNSAATLSDLLADRRPRRSACQVRIRPARRARPGPQRHRALDHAIHRRRRAQLRAEGHEIRDEDVARLSPLKHKNLNVLGRYSFAASTPAGGGLRPLRDPDAAGRGRRGRRGVGGVSQPGLPGGRGSVGRRR